MIIKNSVRYLIFGEIYVRYSEPKNRRRAFALLEAAVQCFDKKGFEHVTLKMIAREAGVSPPLLKHYFSDLEEIREMALKYIRVIGQKVVVDALREENRPDLMLAKYLEAHLFWATHFKSHVRVWISFISASTRLATARSINSNAVLAGKERITALLTRGREEGFFHHSDDDESATFVQTIMTGLVIALMSENLKDPESYGRSLIHQCVRHVCHVS
jgi:AcrR family transcriptional regulator